MIHQISITEIQSDIKELDDTLCYSYIPVNKVFPIAYIFGTDTLYMLAPDNIPPNLPTKSPVNFIYYNDVNPSIIDNRITTTPRRIKIEDILQYLLFRYANIK